MTLSQRLCLRSDSQNRHSFSDRFCDDLCEDILQYLSLEDKIRLQCVSTHTVWTSKQFQRTVFQRQYKLYINMCSEVHKIFFYNEHKFYYYIEDQNIGSFEALLKKCPNITSIDVFGEYYLDLIHNHNKSNQVFLLIIENCNNLREINGLYDINDSNLQEFYRKFGPKIKCFRSRKQLIDFNWFPNIEKIKINYLSGSIIASLKSARLKQLEVVLPQGQEEMLPRVIDTNPKLTHLSVVIKSGDENAVYESLKNISNLKHLIHFKIPFATNNNKFYDLLKQMANNCKYLKSIDCNLNNDQNSDIRQLFSQLKAFPALKRLNLWLKFKDIEVEDNNDVNQLFSFELFKGFANITHLTLGFHYETLKESIFKDIDINLPNLQYLEIVDIFDPTSEGVTKMADILSRLSRLQNLKFEFKSGVDFKPIEEKITKKCRKIKEIKISNI